VTPPQEFDWVFLTYRLPREPSAPRLSLWRAIRRLGALQVSDGLVALPRSTRNLEQLQWLAADIREHDGSSAVWLARPDTARDHAAYIATMRSGIDDEYAAVLAEARALLDREPRHRDDPVDASERRRALRRLRQQLRRISARDYFEAPGGEPARDAVERLARVAEAVPA